MILLFSGYGFYDLMLMNNSYRSFEKATSNVNRIYTIMRN